MYHSSWSHRTRSLADWAVLEVSSQELVQQACGFLVTFREVLQRYDSNYCRSYFQLTEIEETSEALRLKITQPGILLLERSLTTESTKKPELLFRHFELWLDNPSTVSLPIIHTYDSIQHGRLARLRTRRRCTRRLVDYREFASSFKWSNW